MLGFYQELKPIYYPAVLFRLSDCLLKKVNRDPNCFEYIAMHPHW